jgi:hypothetical protein
MERLSELDATGAVLVGLVGLVALGVLGLATTLVRSTRVRRAELAAALEQSRAEVASLSRRVEELSEDVDRAGRAAAREREYVITSLTEVERAGHVTRLPGQITPAPGLGKALEEQLVGALARQDGSQVRGRAVDVVVRTVALGHGIRRALRPEIRDRAAAEAHVARRRSRRVRRQELREARRLLRVVRTHQQDEDVA